MILTCWQTSRKSFLTPTSPIFSFNSPIHLPAPHMYDLGKHRPEPIWEFAKTNSDLIWFKRRLVQINSEFVFAFSPTFFLDQPKKYFFCEILTFENALWLYMSKMRANFAPSTNNKRGCSSKLSVQKITNLYTMKNSTALHRDFSVKATTTSSTLTTLAAIYSTLLDETITLRKLHHLLHVQVAGISLLPLATWDTAALFVGIIWFAVALYGAKTEWDCSK